MEKTADEQAEKTNHSLKNPRRVSGFIAAGFSLRSKRTADRLYNGDEGFMTRYARIGLVLAVARLACAASLEPPKLRLPDTARPVRYAVELTIIPEEDTFTGAI